MRKAKRKESLSSLRKKAWKAFSLFIRYSSADHRGICTCYTCGAQQHWKETDAGHAIPGRTNAVLLDEAIVRPQCKRCNIFLHGNYPVFTTKLIRENGLEWWEEKLAKSRIALKLDRAHFIERIEWYTARVDVIERSQKWLHVEQSGKVGAG